MAGITIEHDDREIRAVLLRLASAGRDLTPAMRNVAALLEASAQRAFERQQSPARADPPGHGPADRRPRQPLLCALSRERALRARFFAASRRRSQRRWEHCIRALRVKS